MTRLRCLIVLTTTLFALSPGGGLADAPLEFRGAWNLRFGLRSDSDARGMRAVAPY